MSLATCNTQSIRTFLHLTLIPFVSHVAMLEPRNVQTNIITYNATLKDIGANWLTALEQIRLGTKLGPGCLTCCIFWSQNWTVNCWTTIHRHNKAVYIYVGWDMVGKLLVSSEFWNPELVDKLFSSLWHEEHNNISCHGRTVLKQNKHVWQRSCKHINTYCIHVCAMYVYLYIYIYINMCVWTLCGHIFV